MPIDYSKYPENWLTEIRPRILNRAKNRCEFDDCDFENGETVWSVKERNKPTFWIRRLDVKTANIVKAVLKQVKVVITIAHLDHDETNLEVKDERLKAACQICHLQYDAKEKQKRKLNKNKPEHETSRF